MFSSIFGNASPSSNEGASSSSSTSSGVNAGQVGVIHPPHERLSNPDSTFGPLTAQDTSWLCGGGFTTETQTFYAMTGGKNAKFLMVQIIHSGVGWVRKLNVLGVASNMSNTVYQPVVSPDSIHLPIF